MRMRMSMSRSATLSTQLAGCSKSTFAKGGRRQAARGARPRTDRAAPARLDAEDRGIKDTDWVKLASRAGDTTLRAKITDRVAPGVVYGLRPIAVLRCIHTIHRAPGESEEKR